MVYNYRAYDDQGSIPGVISGGTFQGDVVNWGTISDGTFLGEVNNDYSYNNNNVSIPGVISGGTFQGTVYNSSIISNGNFQGDVRNYRTISGGTFEKAVEVYASSGTEAKIEGGTFEKGMTSRIITPPSSSKTASLTARLSPKNVTPRFPSPAACLPKL